MSFIRADGHRIRLSQITAYGIDGRSNLPYIDVADTRFTISDESVISKLDKHFNLSPEDHYQALLTESDLCVGVL